MNRGQSMHQKKMNLFLRVLFIILIIAISGAAILQIFAPEYMGRNSAYGISIGWQRKIRFWNIAVLFYRQPLVVGVIYNFFMYCINLGCHIFSSCAIIYLLTN